MIEFARATKQDPNLEFRCATIAETLCEKRNKLFDLIFVKSAYHYFDQQITLTHLKDVLSESGVIVIAERTSRSAQSYCLPEIVKNYWADYFSHSRVACRFAATQSSGLQLSVSCYGTNVDVPINDYAAAIKAKELFGLSAMKPELISDWLTEMSTDNGAKVTVFEDFWLYLYRRPVSTQ